LIQIKVKYSIVFQPIKKDRRKKRIKHLYLNFAIIEIVNNHDTLSGSFYVICAPSHLLMIERCNLNSFESKKEITTTNHQKGENDKQAWNERRADKLI